MAFKTVVLLLGCALIAQSYKQCDMAANLVQIIATCRDILADFNYYVPMETNTAINMTSTANDNVARSKDHQWLSPINIIEDVPLPKGYNETYEDPIPKVKASLKKALDESRACNNDSAGDLLPAINNLILDESRISAIMKEAQRVGGECSCHNDCLPRLLPLATEAVTLALVVPKQLTPVANAIADFSLVSQHCNSREIITRQLETFGIEASVAKIIGNWFR